MAENLVGIRIETHQLYLNIFLLYSKCHFDIHCHLYKMYLGDWGRNLYHIDMNILLWYICLLIHFHKKWGDLCIGDMTVKLPAWLFEGMHTPLKPQMFLWVTQILLLCDSPVWMYSFPKLIPHWSPRQMFPITSFNAGRHRAEMISTFSLLQMIYQY